MMRESLNLPGTIPANMADRSRGVQMARSSIRWTVLCAVATTVCATEVGAQTSAQTSGASSAAQSAATSSDTELTTIIVTATRRFESIQNVASQVTALTAGTLAQINARDLNDFAGFVPGLSFSSTGPSTNLLVLRGITTGSQLSSATGVYLDDIPLGASTSNGVGYQSLNINTFDLNRVEVLNGPQGTLYGATSLGGTIKYIAKTPDLKSFGLDVGVQVSSTQHGHIDHAYTGMLNMPFADIAAIRVDGYQVSTPATPRTQSTGATTKAGLDRKAAGSRCCCSPTITSRFSCVRRLSTFPAKARMLAFAIR